MTQREQEYKRKKKRSQQEQIQIDISDIDLRIKELANEIVNLEHEEGEIKKTKRLRYREMAYHLKEKYLKLGQLEKIPYICREIHNMPQFKSEPNIRIDVARSLDPEFKPKREPRESYDDYEGVANAIAKEVKSLDEYTKNTLEELVNTVDPYEQSIRGNQEAAEFLEKLQIKLEEWSKTTGNPLDIRKRKIGLKDDSSSSSSGGTNKKTLESAPSLETEELQRLSKEYIEQLKSIGDMFHTIAKRAQSHNFTLRTKSGLLQSIRQLEAVRYWIEPYYDAKWQHDYPQWINIYKTYWKYGGSRSAAAVKSAIPVTDVVLDPKTGHIQLRKLTKQEIEAKHDDILSRMAYMCTWLPINGPLHNPFEDVEQLYRKKRQHDLEDKLSDA
jgi:hypothetical protein